ncbi:MAG TPA: anti-sigma factor [Candidatus Limnocylindrales bacterium]|nr:anti-sigma factor [Candidatus Limnocylindrales bacterium]
MDHAQALELIETAAAEPGGLDRLMAGDTPDAAALAGHLAACTTCGRELVRIRRTSETVREVIAASADPALRERTIAYVRVVGRPRTGTADASTPAPVPPVTLPRAVRRTGPLPLPLAWAASIAATAVIALGIGGLLGEPATPAPDPAEALARVTLATLRVEGEPDAERVALVSPTAAGTAGSLVFSPSTGELVVVATDLALPPEGAEYACWVESADGGRRRVGRMFFGGGIAYWAGPVDGLETVEAGDRFGVSLVPVEGDSVATEPVLLGEL